MINSQCLYSLTHTYMAAPLVMSLGAGTKAQHPRAEVGESGGEAGVAHPAAAATAAHSGVICFRASERAAGGSSHCLWQQRTQLVPCHGTPSQDVTWAAVKVGQQ